MPSLQHFRSLPWSVRTISKHKAHTHVRTHARTHTAHWYWKYEHGPISQRLRISVEMRSVRCTGKHECAKYGMGLVLARAGWTQLFFYFLIFRRGGGGGGRGGGEVLVRPSNMPVISGTELHRQFYVLPHWDTSCRSNYFTQSQYTDTRLTSASADPITPDAWQGSHWSANFWVTGMTRPRKNPVASGIRSPDLRLSRRTP